MLSAKNVLHIDGVTISEKGVQMAKCKKKDTACKLVTYRFYRVSSKWNVIQTWYAALSDG